VRFVLLGGRQNQKNPDKPRQTRTFWAAGGRLEQQLSGVEATENEHI